VRGAVHSTRAKAGGPTLMQPTMRGGSHEGSCSQTMCMCMSKELKKLKAWTSQYQLFQIE